MVCRERPQVHADRPGSRATVAMVARGADGGGACRNPDRDAAPQGGAGRDESEDRSQRRARHGAADPHGLVPSGACQAVPAQEIRALLTGRKLLQIKLRDIELGIRGLLRGFGLKVGKVSEGKYDARIRELATGHPMLEPVAAAMLQARASLRAEYAKLHRMLLRIVRADAVCRRFMTAPGIGAVVAVSYRTAVDDPTRFHKSRDLGPYFGLTPSKYQSGEVDRTGRITKVGDAMVRTALFEAAHVILTRVTRFSTLQALRIAKQRGFKRAKVALARKLAVVLHRMWVDGTDFRWRKAAA